jgi:hypothetical protein
MYVPPPLLSLFLSRACRRLEVELKTRNTQVTNARQKEEKPKKYLCGPARPELSRAGEMAGMSRAIRTFAAASRRTLTAASGPALPKEAAAAGARVRAAAPGRMGRDQEDGRRVQWVFLGCPGVGKGTYASRLSQLLGVPHIATGDLVRDALATPGPFSNKVNISLVDYLTLR